MKQQHLPQSEGHLATPGHVPLAAVKVGWDSLLRSKGPWQLWQHKWERGASL